MTSPTDAATIEDELEGKLYNPYLFQKIDGCRRCQEKNQKRRSAAIQDEIDIQSSLFEDGDAVVINAVRRDELIDQPHWVANSVYHQRHPQLPFEDGIVQGTDQARARARIHVTDSDKYIIDVDVVDISPASEGPKQSVVDERQQQYVADDDRHPDGMTVIDRSASDAPAHWPDAEREWLRQLQDSHGPLENSSTDIPLNDDEV